LLASLVTPELAYVLMFSGCVALLKRFVLGCEQLATTGGARLLKGKSIVQVSNSCSVSPLLRGWVGRQCVTSILLRSTQVAHCASYCPLLYSSTSELCKCLRLFAEDLCCDLDQSACRSNRVSERDVANTSIYNCVIYKVPWRGKARCPRRCRN